MQLSIVKKIAIPISIILVLMSLTFAFFIKTNNDTNRILAQLKTQHSIETSARDLRAGINSLLITINDFVITNQRSKFEDSANKFSIVLKRIQHLGRLPIDKGEKQKLAEIKHYMDSIRHASSRLFALRNSGQNEMVNKYVDNLNYKYLGKINDGIILFLDHIEQNSEKEVLSIHRENEKTTSLATIVSLIVLIIAIMIVVMTIKWVSTPILKLVHAAERIATRDFSVKLKNETTDEIGQLVIAFNAMITEINRRYEDLENFSHIVAHDLKSPLSGIIGTSELLTTYYKDKLDSEGNEFLENISLSGKRMVALINDLLNFATAGKVDYSAEPISMNKLLNDIIDDLDYNIKEKNTKIIIQQDLPALRCDPIKLSQVWRNLISNSIKYNDKPDPEIEVGIAAYNEPGHFCFFVKDNGIGIKKDYLEKIFDPFQRATSDSRFEGTGIGLAIVKRTLEFHNGKVWAESVPGQGTTFYFTLQK
jgi:signal transduction histidine kinase